LGSRRVIPKHETKDKEEKRRRWRRRRRMMIHIWENWKIYTHPSLLTLSCPGCHVGVILVLGIHISPNNGPIEMILIEKLIYYVPLIHFCMFNHVNWTIGCQIMVQI
jgi:hypothetical protein